MFTRRTFLQTAALATAGSALMTMPETTFAKKIKAVGIQLYTVRAEMAKDFEGTLKAVAALGYKEFEFAGYNNKTPQEVKALLANLGVTAPSAHFPIAAFEKDLNKTIDTAKAVGHKILICPFLMPNERKTLDDYRRVCSILNRAGEACRAAGIQLGYHNHDFEFKELEGKLPMDLMLAECDKNLVKIELDLGWMTYAGKDPLVYFAKHPGRFISFHVKDMNPNTKEITVELGRGNVDFKRIFAKSKQAGVKHYFVEQDRSTMSPLESIKISMEYLKKLDF
ncbi:MAG: sugar phosphate isomerase/epimerase [Blastocatellia bacterium]|nr:sugar phosphate isomerase/epimerase [Blastocatellia bacterium]